MGKTMADVLKEEGMAIGMERGARRARREMLLVQLRERFNRVPEGVVRRVKATEDIAQLDAWLLAFATAKKLSDVGIPPLA